MVFNCCKPPPDELEVKYNYNCSLALFILVASSFLGVVITISLVLSSTRSNQPAFRIDHHRNTFIKDGEDFRYVSGSFHYFRAMPQKWRSILRTMRAGGLNAVDIYINWALHNPKDGVYNFEGIANITDVIEAAKEEDLVVILRPGPYICAEIDNGGLPFWLFNKYPGIQVRTSDANYMKEVIIWYDNLMTKLKSYMYGNSGPIIMVQIENEYGAFAKCDKIYLKLLKELTKKYVNNDAVLFTVDRPIGDELKCGYIDDDVFVTTDFGLSSDEEVDSYVKKLREVQKTGPLVNTEFYTGWLTHWQEKNQRRPAEPLAKTLRKMLKEGFNVNFYMYFGGTNFGFNAGANDWGIGKYMADITSYDYDAPLDEAGDTTTKYHIFRNVISDFLKLPNITIPNKTPKKKFEAIELKLLDNLLSEISRESLGTYPVVSKTPLTFEQLNQFSGFVLYETKLPKFTRDPSLLKIEDLRDRALIYVDDCFVGVLSRENAINSIPISLGMGSKLQILVENQGRINFQVADDYKGIIGGVQFQQYDEPYFVELNNWTITGFPFEEFDKLKDLLVNANSLHVKNDRRLAINGPLIFYAQFDVPEIADTYIDLTGWIKGFIFVNGFNLGRYWSVGPQITLYLPKELLKEEKNEMFVIELQKAPKEQKIEFRDSPILDDE